MADLLATQAGLDTLNRIACFLGRRRMSRNLKRSFYIAFDGWRNTGYFDKSVMLNELNELTQDELVELNTLLGELGCLENATQAPMTIYVDSVNGSDVSGDGSSTHPYESMAFLSLFPRYINHNVRIILLEDLDMAGEPLNLNFVMGPGGCLSIIGQAAPTVVTTSQGAGPFTITSTNNYGTPPTSDYGHIMQFAEVWGLDELYGKWIRFESGPNQDQVYAVGGNTAHNDIWIRGGITGNPVVGNEITVVEPTITLSCQTINVEITGPRNVFLSTLESSRFNLMNLNVNLTGTYNNGHNFILQGSIEHQISFCTIRTASTQIEPVILQGNLNNYPSCDVGIAAYTNTLIDNIDGIATMPSPCGLLMYNSAFPPFTMTFTSLVIRNADTIRCVSCRGVVIVDQANITVQLCNFGIIRIQGGTSIEFTRNTVDSVAGGSSITLTYANVCHMESIMLSANVAGANIFSLITGMLIINADKIIRAASGLAFTGYGFYYNLGNAKVCANGNFNPLTGTTGDIYFPGGVGGVLFPGADAQQTDNIGNEFNAVTTP